MPTRTVLGPGQWQAFEIQVGAYDLLDVTLQRSDFDNVSFADDPWRDGLMGLAWLSRDTCVRNATVYRQDVKGYCPHGGHLYVDESGNDVAPHRFCSRYENYTYHVRLPDGGTLADREVKVEPGHGNLDDRGYSRVLTRITEQQAALAASMHYPTQLSILAEITRLETEAAHLARTNSTWLRRWPMRMCTSSALAGTYFLTLHASEAMDPRAHSGEVLLTYTNEQFHRIALTNEQPRYGCLRRGGSESFQLVTSAAQPELTSLGMARVESYHVDAADNHISALFVRRGAPPTPTLYDARVAYPALRVAMSACDVSAAQVWFFKLTLAPDATATEVFFELRVSLEDSTRELGDSISGFACCGAYKYYAFPAVEERVAPLVAFNLTSGTVKAIYWRYDSCPIEQSHVVDGACTGWCVLDWYRIYSSNLGMPRYRFSSSLLVPYGMGEEADMRRGGRWYLGIQALDSPATYTLTTGHRAPDAMRAAGCSRLDRYCLLTDRYKDMVMSAAPQRTGKCKWLLSMSWWISVAALLALGSGSDQRSCTRGRTRVVCGASTAQVRPTEPGHLAQGRCFLWSYQL